MQRIKVGLMPLKSHNLKFNTSKAEKLYPKFPKSVNLRQKFEFQTNQAISDLKQFALENEYPNEFEAYRIMKTYYNKFKAVQW
jgi:hypothetical protein